ncbi:ATP-dependent nuclease [Bradyrhizobium sp. 27S5]|uniref:ATP-dependent nuclease n=1 Tax=Bradyrhizobium sp. 27S5 TaxID=3139728 RepID=UPI0030D49528
MTIERVIVRNYRTLYDADLKFGPGTNIIVGDNESGKSTLLEAINLALKRQLSRRPADYELHPFLFNSKTVAEFIASHKFGTPKPPPEILIELYLRDHEDLAVLKGTMNSEILDQPGIALKIKLDDNLKDEYREYIKNPDELRSIPIEYYEIEWLSFAGDLLTSKAIPVKSALIDPSSITNTHAANRYVLEIVRDYLTKVQSVELALSYRKMRDEFQNDARIHAINSDLATKAGIVSDKRLSVAMDVTSRASWETGVMPHLDDIPLTLVGKGEQNAVKVKLAMEASEACDIFLMEEPENHLSHTNLNRLIGKIVAKSEGRQLIITTHSSFVLNKLGIDNTIMFDGRHGVRLNDLPKPTFAYFKKLPGYDTLRMILAKRSILVEGPSDELVVQKAFFQTHGTMPLDAGVEVISVNSLAFKRFLDIARLLKIDVSVVTDNDSNEEAKTASYAEYAKHENISVCIGKGDKFPTLEPQLLNANGLTRLNSLLGTSYAEGDALLDYMKSHKTDVALKLFDSARPFIIPDYIKDAIR